MKTVIEGDRDGKPVRVYHGTASRAWTHRLEDRATCAACQRGTIPADVKDGRNPK